VESEWKAYLNQVRAETNPDRLADCINLAEEAITARVTGMLDSNGHQEEIAQLKAAGEELQRIQVERLGFPDWKDTLKNS
jgi:hypothetical protein